MRIKVLTTNQRDCCPSMGHNINSNFTHFLLKIFVLSFVSRAKPTIAVLNKMRYTPIATDAHGGHGGLCPPEHLMLLRKAILHCLLIVLDARVVRNRVFLPKDALQTAEQGKKPGYEGFDASRTN